MQSVQEPLDEIAGLQVKTVQQRHDLRVETVDEAFVLACLHPSYLLVWVASWGISSSSCWMIASVDLSFRIGVKTADDAMSQDHGGDRHHILAGDVEAPLAGRAGAACQNQVLARSRTGSPANPTRNALQKRRRSMVASREPIASRSRSRSSRRECVRPRRDRPSRPRQVIRGWRPSSGVNE